MYKRISFSTAVAACALLVTAVSLRTRAAEHEKDVSAADKVFVEKAANGGMAEVALGKLAQTKATNEAVKKFGERMVEDHSKANEQLMKVAEEKGIKLSPAIHGEHKEAYDRLAAFDGEKFDREFMTHMVKDHVEDIADFKKEAEHGDDTRIKNFASETLPTLREHLHMANEIAPKVGAKSEEEPK